jgi:hypothetical protein
MASCLLLLYILNSRLTPSFICISKLARSRVFSQAKKLTYIDRHKSRNIALSLASRKQAGTAFDKSFSCKGQHAFTAESPDHYLHAMHATGDLGCITCRTSFQVNTQCRQHAARGSGRPHTLDNKFVSYNRSPAQNTILCTLQELQLTCQSSLTRLTSPSHPT